MPPAAAHALRANPWFARAALFLVGWTLIGLLYAGQFYYTSAKAGRTYSFTQALTWSLADWYVFAALSIPTIYLARRFVLFGRPWARVAIFHLGVSALFSVAYMIVRAWVGRWEAVTGVANVTFAQAFNEVSKTFIFNIWIYWIIVSVTQVVTFYQELHARELRNRELETGLARARLQALQMQLNPHFLFNTLHTISALMHKDVNAADDMLSHLSLLLRETLESSGSHEVQLSEEVDFLKRYLHIEQTRFGERLNIHWDIHPDTLNAYVPTLVLQPIIENAIRHGIEPHARPGVVHIAAKRAGEHLVLSVRDNGSGLPSTGRIREGVGLSNTRGRLEQLYGKRCSFEYLNAPNGGLEVRITFPYQSARVLQTEHT
ncbi:MAG TPA: histidine kinase [Methylomirabilota bacterium]|nr:histidine kinase [Methylomirabilota bacterium]